MKKILRYLSVALCALLLWSCGDGGEEPPHNVSVKRVLVSHVVDGSDVTLSRGTFSIEVNRASQVASISGTVAGVSLNLTDIKVAYDLSIQYVEFEPWQGDVNGHKVMITSGYYDIYNDLIVLRMEVDGKKVELTRESVFFMTTKTESDSLKMHYTYSNALYDFTIDTDKMTATVTMGNIGFSSNRGVITRLRYSGLSVSLTESGYEITGEEVWPEPIDLTRDSATGEIDRTLTWVDIYASQHPDKYVLNTFRANLDLAAESLDGEFVTPFYQVKMKGKYFVRPEY